MSQTLRPAFDLGKSERRFRVALGVLVAVVLSGLIAAGTISLRISEISRNFAAPNEDNLAWRLAQLDLEYLTFIYELRQPDPLDAVSFADDDWAGIVERFDIFYARTDSIAFLLDSRNLLDPGLEARARAMSRLVTHRDALARQIDGMDPKQPRMVAELRAAAETNRPVVREIVMQGLAIIHENGKRTEANLANLVWLGQLGLISFMIILVVIMGLLAFFYRRMMKNAYLIQNSESTLRKIMVAMPDPIVVFDPTGQIVDLNHAAQEMFGHDRASAVGQNVINLLLGRRRVARFLQWTRAKNSAALIHSALGRRVHLSATHAQGHGMRIEVASAQGCSPSGLFYIALVRDVSDRVQGERKLRRLYQVAAALAKSKDRFLSVMSHEMRTPLHGVIASLDLIASTSLDKSVERLISIARSSARTAITQIEDVLDAARIRNGATAEALVPFSPGAVTRGVVEEHMPLTRNRNNTIVLEDAMSRNLNIAGRARTFRRALSNLVSNACKFTLNGKIVVRLTDHIPGFLRVEVEDTGAGIPADLIARVFGEFFTLDQDGWGGSGGAGLGLPIFVSAVAVLGGTYGVRSTYGVGSMFWFEFPHTSTPQSSLSGPVEAIATGKLSVLVVDDSEFSRELLAKMVEQLGHVPTMAEDGSVAVTMARQMQYDVILTDIRMPKMDGFEVARQIAAGGLSRKALKVGVTAHLSQTPSDRAAALAAGLVDILVKPVTVQDIAGIFAGASQAVWPEVSEGGSCVEAVVLDPERWLDMAALNRDGWVENHLSIHFHDVSVLCDKIALLQLNTAEISLAEVAHGAAGVAVMMGLMQQHAGLACLEDQLRGAGLSDPAAEADIQRAMSERAAAATRNAH